MFSVFVLYMRSFTLPVYVYTLVVPTVDVVSGVLVFAENPMSREKLLLQLVDSSAVLFEFSDVTTTCSVRSNTAVHRGVWYRVTASRYAVIFSSSLLLLCNWIRLSSALRPR